MTKHIKKLIVAVTLALSSFTVFAYQAEPASAYITGCSAQYSPYNTIVSARCTGWNSLSPIQNQWLWSGWCRKSDLTPVVKVNTGWHNVGSTWYSTQQCPAGTYLNGGGSFSYRL